MPKRTFLLALAVAACFLLSLLAAGPSSLHPENRPAIWPGAVEQAFAEDMVITVPPGGVPPVPSSSSKTGKTTKKTSPANNSRGNNDSFIGLSKGTIVLATAKTKVRVHKKASVKSKVLGSFLKNSCIVVDNSAMRKGGKYKWLKVRLAGKKRGYVQLSKVTLGTLNTADFGLDPSIAANKKRIKVCRYALPYLGTRYRHGNSLKYGIDCCHLVQRAMSSQGYMKSGWYARHAGNCLRAGKAVKKSQLMPGDLVGYPQRSGGIVHVGIYLGKGYLINASSKYGLNYPSGGIRISKINYRHPAASKFRRVIF